jgi:putative transcriptional regulator
VIVNRVSTLLGARRRSVAEVARSAGISRGALHRLYHDRVGAVDLQILDALCRELGCQVGELFCYVEDGEGTTDGR